MIKWIKWIKWIKSVVPLVLALMANEVYAAKAVVPYYWLTQYEFISKADSLKQSCLNYIDYVNKIKSDPKILSYQLEEFYYISQSRYFCRISYDWYNERLGQYVRIKLSPYTINRHGNACPMTSQINPTTGPCNNDEQKGPPQENACAGNPINFAIGNKFQTESDYSASSNSLLSFSRNYNSLDGLWRHSFSSYLRFAGTQHVSVVMRHGRESFFIVSGETATPTSADLGMLSKVGTTGWQYVSMDNERFTFDTAGKLTQLSNAHGAVHQLTYGGNQVTVTDNLGNSLSFTEDADHQPLTLTASGVQITYGYDANKRLTSVTRVVGGQTTQRQFHYEDSRNSSWLTGITDERGVRYATWSYDDKGRAISSEHADGADKVTVAYNPDGTVLVTNELGKVANYSFQYIKGVMRITSIQGEPSVNCPNSNSSFTYDSNGQLKTKIDNKGVLTTYDYNTRGLEISRTEASGTPQARTITTEWHPTLFLPVTVTEPSRITTYTYDVQGRQLSQSVTQR
jgi:YD repeat-containing protein